MNKLRIILLMLFVFPGCVKIETTNLFRKLVLYSVLNTRSAYHTIVLDSVYPLDNAIVIDSCGIRDADIVLTDDQGNSYLFDSLDEKGHYVNRVPFYPVPGRKYSIDLKYKDFYEANITTRCPDEVTFNKQVYFVNLTSMDTIYWNYTSDCLYNVVVWDSTYGYTDYYEYSEDTSFNTEQLIEYYNPAISDTNAINLKFYVYKYDKNYSDWYTEQYYSNEFNPIEDKKPYIGYFASCTVDSVDVIINP